MIFLWVVTARHCEMGVSMSSRIGRVLLLCSSAFASLYGLGGMGSAQTSVTLPTVEVVASEKKPAVAQPAPGPAQPASETPEGAAARQLAEKAKTFDASRSNLFTTIGTTSYKISHDDIQALPQGVNQPVEKVLLQAPGVSQDSAASGLLHIRNDHANVQFRINGVMLPDGVTGFGSIFDTSLIGNMSLVTGALPAEFGLRTVGLVDIATGRMSSTTAAASAHTAEVAAPSRRSSNMAARSEAIADPRRARSPSMSDRGLFPGRPILFHRTLSADHRGNRKLDARVERHT